MADDVPQTADPTDPPEEKEVVQDAAEEEAVHEEPSEEETPEEVEEPEGAEEEETPEPAEEERPPSRRESLRIQKLISKMKQQPQAQQYQAQGMDYRQAINADDEVYNQLEADRQQVANIGFNEGLSRAQSIQWRTSLELDNPKIEAKYPQLNKESDQFNPAAADAINSWYLSSVGYDPQTQTVANPGVRYAEFVEGIMELADEMAGARVERTSRNIAQQAASTGLRPDGSTARRMNLNKAPEDMTDEELNAVISQALPKK